MNVASLCTRPVVSIDADASLQSAAALMRLEHVGSLVVTRGADGEQPHAVGPVTDRDLAIEAQACEADPHRGRIGDLASRELVTVSADAGLAEALGAMAKAGVRRLLVVDREHRIAGLVSMDDLMGAMSGELGAMAEALPSGLERERRTRPAAMQPRPPVFLSFGTPGTSG